MSNKIDATDLLILKELRENCKKPIRELSKMLKIHPNTLLLRIRKLEKNKVIRKYQANVDYSKLHYDIHAIVMIRISRRGLEDPNLLKSVVAIPEVEAAYAVTGSADVIAIIRAKNRQHMTEVLRAIQGQEKITRTTTHLVLMTYKYPHDFNPLSNLTPLKK